MRFSLYGIALFLLGLLYLSENAGYSLGVHDDIVMIGCLQCHERLPFAGHQIFFTETVNRACMECHQAHSYFSHPIKVVPSMPVPADMPLDKDGKIACITCHTFHEGFINTEGRQKTSFLRRTMPGQLFCFSCHKNLQELK